MLILYNKTDVWLNVCTPLELKYVVHLCPIYYRENVFGSFANSKPQLLSLHLSQNNQQGLQCPQFLELYTNQNIQNTT